MPRCRRRNRQLRSDVTNTVRDGQSSPFASQFYCSTMLQDPRLKASFLSGCHCHCPILLHFNTYNTTVASELTCCTNPIRVSGVAQRISVFDLGIMAAPWRQRMHDRCIHWCIAVKIMPPVADGDESMPFSLPPFQDLRLALELPLLPSININPAAPKTQGTTPRQAVCGSAGSFSSPLRPNPKCSLRINPRDHDTTPHPSGPACQPAASHHSEF